MPAIVLARLVAVVTIGAALLTNIATGFAVLGGILGVASFVLWFRNRHNLAALNDFLAHKAHVGLEAIDGG